MRKYQRTIARPANLEGPGLFSGTQAKMTLRPADPDEGITFIRTDLPGRPRIPLSHETIASKFRRTSVSLGDAEVETVEHLLSATTGLGIDNLRIDLDAKEVPHQDGSSRIFVESMKEAGIVEQAEPRRMISIREPISVIENDASIIALPTDGPFEVSYTMQYDGPIGRQHYTLEVNERNYTEEISPARTFCLQSDAEAFQQQGLGSGGTYETAIVVGPKGPINNKLRFPDEYVRHKILDLLGDLAALNAGLRGHIVAIRSGHSSNIKLVKKIG